MSRGCCKKMSRSYISRSLREQVGKDARYRCGYCLTSARITGTAMEVDHIIPESLGGLTVRENLWLACSMCNDHKGNRIAAPDPPSPERWCGSLTRADRSGRIISVGARRGTSSSGRRQPAEPRSLQFD